jgi:hypothetical protein
MITPLRAMVRNPPQKPFALSLSKGCPSFDAGQGQGQGFDKLSPNGVEGRSPPKSVVASAAQQSSRTAPLDRRVAALLAMTKSFLLSTLEI